MNYVGAVRRDANVNVPDTFVGQEHHVADRRALSENVQAPHRWGNRATLPAGLNDDDDDAPVATVDVVWTNPQGTEHTLALIPDSLEDEIEDLEFAFSGDPLQDDELEYRSCPEELPLPEVTAAQEADPASGSAAGPAHADVAKKRQRALDAAEKRKKAREDALDLDPE